MVSKANVLPSITVEKDSTETISSNHFWSTPVPFFTSPKSGSVTDMRVAAIVSERLYQGLKPECDLLLVTPDNWRYVFDYADVEFLLIESCWDTATGHWHLSQLQDSDDNSLLAEVIEYCHAKKLASVYWNTQDTIYHDHFLNIIKRCEHVFCADIHEIEKLEMDGVDAELLLPAIQPVIHNPFKNFDDASSFKIDILFDGWADILRMSDQLAFLKQLRDKGLKIIESQYRLFKQKLVDTAEYKANILGAVTQSSRLLALKYSKLSITSSQTLSTPVRQQWLSLEMAACRVPILHRGFISSDDVRAEIIECYDSDEKLLTAVDLMLTENSLREKKSHLAWRHVHKNHTFSHRMRAICNKVGVDYPCEEFPLVSVIIATFRVNLITACINTFEMQTYPNKELVLVVNSSDFTQGEAAELIGEKEKIRIYVVPKERVEGGCLNVAIANAKGEFCVKMDDDDHYSNDFVQDMMLHEKAVDADVFGKANSYIHFEDDDSTYERDSRPQLTIIPESKILQAHISGNSLSGKRQFFLKHRYSDTNVASTDTCYHGNIEGNKAVYALFDNLGLIMERSADVSKHSWRLDSTHLKKSMRFMSHGVEKNIIV